MHDDTERNTPSDTHIQKKEQPKTPRFRDDVIRFALIFLLIIVPIRFFVAQPFVVSGSSMDPTFHSKDYLIVDQVGPKIGEGWQRLDIVVFKFPFEKSRFLIKRIIALPGETVTSKDGVITIFNEENPDGLTLDEPYVTHELKDSFTTTLSSGQYFVMGDNRAGSYDSRAWGPLSEDLLVGRPLIRLFPFNSISITPGHLE